HLREHHAHSAQTDWAAVQADVEQLVASIRERSIAELEASALAGQLFELARKHHIRPMCELSLVLLGRVTVEGIAKRLDPGVNILREVAAFSAPAPARPRFARGSSPWIAATPSASSPARTPASMDGDARAVSSCKALCIRGT